MKISSALKTKKIEIEIPHQPGFQLRLASQFSQCMQRFSSNIQVRKGEVLADGKNIIDLLVLEAGWKSKLEIVAVGDDAVQAIESAKDFFSKQENTSSQCF